MVPEKRESDPSGGKNVEGQTLTSASSLLVCSQGPLLQFTRRTHQAQLCAL